MTRSEIYNDVFRDANVISRTTLFRLFNKYIKERRRFKVSKKIEYQKFYEVRTKRKNRWIIALSKAPSVRSFKGHDSINYLLFIYHNTKRGFRVFKPNLDTEILFAYNGHVFTRYAERMNLKINSPIDKVKHFIKYNGYGQGSTENEKIQTSVKDGLLLGDFDPKNRWVTYKTFVNNSLLRLMQRELKEDIKESLDVDIQELINSETFTSMDRYAYNVITDIRCAIGGS